MNSRVAAIILAAGASSRLGQPKQLLLHQGETLLARAMRLAVEAKASPVIVVLGAHYELICQAVDFHGSVPLTIPVINDQWKQGIGSSIRAGIEALTVVAPNIAGALILACDQPELTASHLAALIQAFDRQPESSIAASTYANAIGIPALFPHSAFPQLLALRGDQGARAVLLQPPCPLLALPFLDGEIDIDQPDDLSRLQ